MKWPKFLHFRIEQNRKFEELQLATGLMTKAEVVRDALELLAWAVSVYRSGNLLVVVSRDGKAEPVYRKSLDMARTRSGYK